VAPPLGIVNNNHQHLYPNPQRLQFAAVLMMSYWILVGNSAVRFTQDQESTMRVTLLCRLKMPLGYVLQLRE
jgi:hypothetical protein